MYQNMPWSWHACHTFLPSTSTLIFLYAERIDTLMHRVTHKHVLFMYCLWTGSVHARFFLGHASAGCLRHRRHNKPDIEVASEVGWGRSETWHTFKACVHLFVRRRTNRRIVAIRRLFANSCAIHAALTCLHPVHVFMLEAPWLSSQKSPVTPSRNTRRLCSELHSVPSWGCWWP